MAATEGTQTEAGDGNDDAPIEDGPCKEAGATTGANLEPGGATAPASTSAHQCEAGETAATGVDPSQGEFHPLANGRPWEELHPPKPRR